MKPSRGYIYVATGEGYVALAARSAQLAKAHNPEIEIDLYTDKACEFPQFDQVHLLADPWHRSKIDGMIATRFDQTVYIDADTLVLADISDIFDVLGRFDMAMAHDQGRNGDWAQTLWREEIPHAFPQFNSGVVAFNKSDAVISFLTEWKTAVRETKSRQDQNILREMAWHSDLRFGVLPEEYNLMYFRVVERWGAPHAAPRVIHSPRLHHHFTSTRRRTGISGLEELVGPMASEKIQDMIRADHSLAKRAGRKAERPSSRVMLWRRKIEIALKVVRYYAGLRKL
ncbi:putative nucleotide-diphospho-sugar transferase [Algihabitans albus]|uniref:putative nucleotide-diphospho-sugar transferase n=1 Tax=Algihabitans albus TaxID=2164067 RepID=UPI000E5D588E|nr:putative nucleotide-diphospho-sugar transferase [Algihabitans albus]